MNYWNYFKKYCFFMLLALACASVSRGMAQRFTEEIKTALGQDIKKIEAGGSYVPSALYQVRRSKLPEDVAKLQNNYNAAYNTALLLKKEKEKFEEQVAKIMSLLPTEKEAPSSKAETPLTQEEAVSKWEEIAKRNNELVAYFFSGYFFIKFPKFNNNRSSLEVENLKSLEKKEPKRVMYSKAASILEKEIGLPEKMKDQEYEDKAKQVAERLVGLYKIHLMPQDNEMTPIFEKLINLIKTDKTFTELTYIMKFYPNYHKTHVQVQEEEMVMPRVVIYPINGKENAQKLLNHLYTKLSDFKGMDVTPRFNEKITDLIYVAQGDADHKKYPTYDKYYEKPDKVYYSSDYFRDNYGITGDMKLKNPAKK